MPRRSDEYFPEGDDIFDEEDEFGEMIFDEEELDDIDNEDVDAIDWDTMF